MRHHKARNAAFLLGIGLGGFADGILLHQIAHWHQMLSSRLAPTSVEAMQRNMLADGWFHLAAWAVTFAGVLVLWSALRGPGRMLPTRSFFGYMLAGWGAFNLAEGVVNHHLLELHHVRDLPVHMPVYDWVFLAISAALVVIGMALRDRTAEPETERRVRERRLAY